MKIQHFSTVFCINCSKKTELVLNGLKIRTSSLWIQLPVSSFNERSTNSTMDKSNKHSETFSICKAQPLSSEINSKGHFKKLLTTLNVCLKKVVWLSSTLVSEEHSPEKKDSKIW